MPITTKPAVIHTVEEAKALAEQAISLLVGHNVPPSPQSYTVAYEYFSGTNADLQKALDEHLQTGLQIDVFMLRDLYDQHIASVQFRYLRGMGSDLQNILQSLLQSIAEAGDGTQAFGEILARGIDHLSSDIGPQTLQEVAADILIATQDAQALNNHLQQSLENTRRETESLKTEMEQYRREALIDPLTGLFNRRAMDAHLEGLMAAPGADRHLSLVMVDIDHFKSINDTYGHALGDMVIRNVAETIRKCIRGGDFAVRYGGEEFIVLLPATPLAGAVTVAETIRSRIESLRLVRLRDNFTLAPVTVSVGVSARRPDDTRESLFHRADQALYQAKNRGRNLVVKEDAAA